MKKNAVKIALAGAILTAAVALWYAVTREPFESRKPAVGDMAPEIFLSDASGTMLKLSDFANKVVLINFWASWCPPCVSQMAGFQKVNDTYGDKGFAIISIVLDDPKPAVIRDLNVSFPVLKINDRVKRDYGNISDVPVSFLIGKNGRIVKKLNSAYVEAALKTDVEQAMGK